MGRLLPTSWSVGVGAAGLVWRAAHRFHARFSGPGRVREHMGRLGFGGAGLRAVDATGRIG